MCVKTHVASATGTHRDETRKEKGKVAFSFPPLYPLTKFSVSAFSSHSLELTFLASHAGGGPSRGSPPRRALSLKKRKKEIEPSQMVFQGDARNELGPSPRGAIYRKHQKTTSVETSFHKKFGTELPRLEYCRARKPATTPGRNEF